MLTIHVTGTPAPQGSKRAFVNRKTGRAVVVDDNKATLRNWRQDVKAATLNAIAELGAGWQQPTGPVAVLVTFRMSRPGYHFGSGRNAHRLKPSAPHYCDKRPDLDKLARAVGDALKQGSAYRDDAQVARLTVEKQYAEPGQPAGATIIVRTLDDVSQSAVPAVASTPAAGTAPVQGAIF